LFVKALQPYSAHQAKMQLTIKSLREPYHKGYYISDCLLDPRTFLILTTEFVLVLSRQNLDSEWEVDNNNPIGRTTPLVHLAKDPERAVKTDLHKIHFYQESGEKPVMMPQRETCREFADQVKQQLREIFL
jgi:hypothetical protein